MQRLWMWYVPGTDEQVTAACLAAEKELKNRGVSIGAAFQATVEANDLDGTYAGENTPDADAVAAWYAAEFTALSHLADSSGEWPSQGAMIVLDEGRR